MNGNFRIFITLALGVGFFFSASFSLAVEITPFYTQNQSPAVRIFGMPSIGDASLLLPGKADLKLIVDWTNNYVDDFNPRERIILDGESVKTSLDARCGIFNNFEVGVVIPYLYESGGILDGFIDGYHDTFNIKSGGRNEAPRNRLLYQYVKDGREGLRMDDSGGGLGDISLNGAWQVYGGVNRPSSVALRASLKFPTGDPDYLRGSGSTDLALWAIGSRDFNVGFGHLTLYGAVGLMGMTGGEVLKDQHRNLVGFGALGVGWSPVWWIAFKIQANGHTAFYRDSELEELNSHSIQLTMGGTLAFSQSTALDIGVMEDVMIRTSPDVVFHLALRHSF